MGRYERSIKIVFDKISGEVLNADQVFDDKKDAFIIRRQFHQDEVELYCCECEQRLNVSTSKFDRLHFKHQPNADYCILKDGKLTPEEVEQFNRILLAKESQRHKDLKSKIGEKLKEVEGIDGQSIAVDNRFIIRGDEKRRPDVYCKYYNKELVFEIQLSDLSLRYILSRYDFYRKHGIYLIWILDNFDIHRQAQLERDIKYLTKYQNFFKLDEHAKDLHLHCDYKYPFLTQENELHTKWIRKSIQLNEVHFDSENYQIFYFNFGDNLTKTEEEQSRRAKRIKEEEQRRIAEKRLERAKHKAQEIIQEIKELRSKKSQVFGSAMGLINNLDGFEQQTLNSMLNLNEEKEGKKLALHQWLSTSTQEDVAFLDFILKCDSIHVDVNKTDPIGKTAFQLVFDNNNIHREVPLKALLSRGYRLTPEDENYFNALPGDKRLLRDDWVLYNACNNLSNRNLVNAVFAHNKLVFIIESARRKEIVGFNFRPSDWIAFANNALQYRSEYWEYIELAFKRYELWDRLLQSDKKGTFERKVQAFYSKLPKQKFDFDEVFRDLYPELCY